MRKATKKAAKKKTAGRAVRAGAKAWDQQDVRQLRSLYDTHTAQQIAKILGRSLASVKAKIRTLGLKKPPAAQRRILRERAARKGGAKKKTTTKKKSSVRRAPARKRTAVKKNRSRRRR